MTYSSEGSVERLPVSLGPKPCSAFDKCLWLTEQCVVPCFTAPEIGETCFCSPVRTVTSLGRAQVSGPGYCYSLMLTNSCLSL